MRFLWIILISSFFITPAFSAAQNSFYDLERSSTGHLGVYAINTANKQQVAYHAEQRVPMGSTAKVMVVAAILKASMSNKKLLQEKINYTQNDITSSGYSPITQKNLAGGMTVKQLCAAAIVYSDNTAVNLLIKKLGGSAAINVFARSIGDHSFQLNRIEPELNSAIPGDTRDTSTPKAMAISLEKITLGNILASAQRMQLQDWLKSNTT